MVTKFAGSTSVAPQTGGTGKLRPSKSAKIEVKVNGTTEEGAKPVETQGAASASSTEDEIEAIFSKKADKLKASHESKATGRSNEADNPRPQKGRKQGGSERGSSSDPGQSKKQRKSFLDSKPRPTRRTEEGYAVYKEDDLGWNKRNAGGTRLCPFDCDCCF